MIKPVATTMPKQIEYWSMDRNHIIHTNVLAKGAVIPVPAFQGSVLGTLEQFSHLNIYRKSKSVHSID